MKETLRDAKKGVGYVGLVWFLLAGLSIIVHHVEAVFTSPKRQIIRAVVEKRIEIKTNYEAKFYCDDKKIGEGTEVVYGGDCFWFEVIEK